jgi:hypothetical protein
VVFIRDGDFILGLADQLDGTARVASECRTIDLLGALDVVDGRLQRLLGVLEVRMGKRESRGARSERNGRGNAANECSK